MGHCYQKNPDLWLEKNYPEEIISLLTQEAMPMNAIAERFPDTSRPAISKHVKVLTDQGLIMIHKEGRERFCQAQLAPLKEIS
jgi:DNA-binding transcriptional ArsR family regulator